MDESGNILLGEKNARQHADKKDSDGNERNKQVFSGKFFDQ
jgi:hypothetical protein